MTSGRMNPMIGIHRNTSCTIDGLARPGPRRASSTPPFREISRVGEHRSREGERMSDPTVVEAVQPPRGQPPRDYEKPSRLPWILFLVALVLAGASAWLL